jgi:hypothetical protein
MPALKHNSLAVSSDSSPQDAETGLGSQGSPLTLLPMLQDPASFLDPAPSQQPRSYVGPTSGGGNDNQGLPTQNQP